MCTRYQTVNPLKSFNSSKCIRIILILESKTTNLLNKSMPIGKSYVLGSSPVVDSPVRFISLPQAMRPLSSGVPIYK